MTEAHSTNGIYAKVLADSLAPNGKRLTSFEIQLPKVFLAENNTHKALSKNFSSSRAIPVGKNNEVQSFEPRYYGANKSGMQSEGIIDYPEKAQEIWYGIIKACKEGSQALQELGLHKQWSNRPNDWHTMAKGVTSGTDWDNFLYLRNDSDAQPEFQALAGCIQECFDKSVPQLLLPGEWHLPYIETRRDTETGVLYYFDSDGNELTLQEAKEISASCVAQVSHRKLNETKEKALEIFGKLFSGKKPHMSPTEHAGTPISGDVIPFDPSTWTDGITHVRRDGTLCSGNFASFIQYRQTLPNNVFVKG